VGANASDWLPLHRRLPLPLPDCYRLHTLAQILAPPAEAGPSKSLALQLRQPHPLLGRNFHPCSFSSGLHDDTNGEDADSEDDRPSPTDVCGGGGKKGTKESTSGQNGDDEGLLGWSDAAHPGGGINCIEGAQPVPHGMDAGDDTGIITKEDTTKGGKDCLHGGRWLECGDARWERVGTYREDTSPDIPGCVSTDAITGSDCSSRHD